MYAKKIKEKKLSWGATILATPFPSEDVVSIVGSVVGGSRLWGSDEAAQTHAAMLLEGTTKRTKKDIQLFLDSIGAQLSFGATSNRLSFSAKVRPMHLETLLELIVECLTLPAFPEKELEILKKREVGSLSLEAQDTRMQADIVLSRLLYRPSHPNHEDTTAESLNILQALTSKKLRDGHKKYLTGKGLVISFAGDIQPAKVFTLAEKYFSRLPRITIKLPSFTKATASTVSKKAQAIIKNKASIDYMIGRTTGITNEHKDYPALMLGMNILAKPSGFVGRMMKTVREEDGLTYGVYGYLAGFSREVDGYLYIWATFAPQLFEKGQTAIMREIQKIITEGATKEEVSRHATLYEASSRVQLSNSGAFARAAHNVITDGKPLSYLDTFPKKVLKLSQKEVHSVLKKYLVPKHLSEAAAGPVEK